ncbi:Mbov_0399 family ICE element protein [Mycoplasma sp. 394]
MKKSLKKISMLGVMLTPILTLNAISYVYDNDNHPFGENVALDNVGILNKARWNNDYVWLKDVNTNSYTFNGVKWKSNVDFLNHSMYYKEDINNKLNFNFGNNVGINKIYWNQAFDYQYENPDLEGIYEDAEAESGNKVWFYNLNSSSRRKQITLNEWNSGLWGILDQSDSAVYYYDSNKGHEYDSYQKITSNNLIHLPTESTNLYTVLSNAGISESDVGYTTKLAENFNGDYISLVYVKNADKFVDWLNNKGISLSNFAKDNNFKFDEEKVTSIPNKANANSKFSSYDFFNPYNSHARVFYLGYDFCSWFGCEYEESYKSMFYDSGNHILWFNISYNDYKRGNYYKNMVDINIKLNPYKKEQQNSMWNPVYDNGAYYSYYLFNFQQKQDLWPSTYIQGIKTLNGNSTLLLDDNTHTPHDPNITYLKVKQKQNYIYNTTSLYDLRNDEFEVLYNVLNNISNNKNQNKYVKYVFNDWIKDNVIHLVTDAGKNSKLNDNNLLKEVADAGGKGNLDKINQLVNSKSYEVNYGNLKIVFSFQAAFNTNNKLGLKLVLKDILYNNVSIKNDLSSKIWYTLTKKDELREFLNKLNLYNSGDNDSYKVSRYNYYESMLELIEGVIDQGSQLVVNNIPIILENSELYNRYASNAELASRLQIDYSYVVNDANSLNNLYDDQKSWSDRINEQWIKDTPKQLQPPENLKHYGGKWEVKGPIKVIFDVLNKNNKYIENEVLIVNGQRVDVLNGHFEIELRDERNGIDDKEKVLNDPNSNQEPNENNSHAKNEYKIEVIKFKPDTNNSVIDFTYKIDYIINSYPLVQDIKYYAWNPDVNPKQKEIITPYLYDEQGKVLKDDQGKKIKNPKYDPLINPNTGTKDQLVWIKKEFLDKFKNVLPKLYFLYPNLSNVDLSLGIFANAAVLGKGALRNLLLNENASDYYVVQLYKKVNNTFNISGEIIDLPTLNANSESSYMSTEGLYFIVGRSNNQISNVQLVLIDKDNQPDQYFSDAIKDKVVNNNYAQQSNDPTGSIEYKRRVEEHKQQQQESINIKKQLQDILNSLQKVENKNLVRNFLNNYDQKGYYEKQDFLKQAQDILAKEPKNVTFSDYINYLWNDPNVVPSTFTNWLIKKRSFDLKTIASFNLNNTIKEYMDFVNNSYAYNYDQVKPLTNPFNVYNFNANDKLNLNGITINQLWYLNGDGKPDDINKNQGNGIVKKLLDYADNLMYKYSLSIGSDPLKYGVDYVIQPFNVLINNVEINNFAKTFTDPSKIVASNPIIYKLPIKGLGKYAGGFVELEFLNSAQNVIYPPIDLKDFTLNDHEIEVNKKPIRSAIVKRFENVLTNNHINDINLFKSEQDTDIKGESVNVIQNKNPDAKLSTDNIINLEFEDLKLSYIIKLLKDDYLFANYVDKKYQEVIANKLKKYVQEYLNKESEKLLENDPKRMLYKPLKLDRDVKIDNYLLNTMLLKNTNNNLNIKIISNNINIINSFSFKFKNIGKNDEVNLNDLSDVLLTNDKILNVDNTSDAKYKITNYIQDQSRSIGLYANKDYLIYGAGYNIPWLDVILNTDAVNLYTQEELNELQSKDIDAYTRALAINNFRTYYLFNEENIDEKNIDINKKWIPFIRTFREFYLTENTYDDGSGIKKQIDFIPNIRTDRELTNLLKNKLHDQEIRIKQTTKKDYPKDVIYLKNLVIMPIKNRSFGFAYGKVINHLSPEQVFEIQNSNKYVDQEARTLNEEVKKLNKKWQEERNLKTKQEIANLQTKNTNNPNNQNVNQKNPDAPKNGELQDPKNNNQNVITNDPKNSNNLKQVKKTGEEITKDRIKDLSEHKTPDQKHIDQENKEHILPNLDAKKINRSISQIIGYSFGGIALLGAIIGLVILAKILAVKYGWKLGLASKTARSYLITNDFATYRFYKFKIKIKTSPFKLKLKWLYQVNKSEIINDVE